MKKKMIPRNAPLNIVPFIDIMLVLLCIVLSVSTFIAQGHIKVSLPEVNNQEKNENNDNESLLLEIGEQNEIVLDGKTITPDELQNALKTLSRSTHLELRIDKGADFGGFVKVIDILKELKHDKFSIATREIQR